MPKRASLLTLLAAVTLSWSSAFAHHSFSAEFDASKVVHLEGTVVKFAWVNPHSWIYMDVMKADGSVEHWKIGGRAELAAAARVEQGLRATGREDRRQCLPGSRRCSARQRP